MAVFIASFSVTAQQQTSPQAPSKDSLRDVAWTTRKDAADSDKLRSRSDALSVLDSNPRAIAVVIAALQDKEDSIRALAATSLGDMKARSAIPALRKAMDDPSPVVSFAAAESLWKMGDRSGRELLVV